MALKSFAVAAVALASVIVASPHSINLPRQAQVVPPSQDPFYSAPPNFADAAPGTILNTRVAPGNLTSVIHNSSEAYQVNYRTTDSNNQPAWAIMTVLVPCEPSLEPTPKFVAYQVPYDSCDPDGAITYQLYQSEDPVMWSYLQQGWYLTVADYEGPNGSFICGAQSGHATLDAVRATLSMPELGNLGANNARYVMNGYSGGSFASGWAAELQADYAPELQFAGTAIGGVTPNVTNVLLSVDGTNTTGQIPQGIIGFGTQHEDFAEYIDQHLKKTGPYNATGFYMARNLNSPEGYAYYYGQKFENYFDIGFSIFQAPEVQGPLNQDSQMGLHGVPQMPTFVYKAIGDEDSPIADTDALVNTWCAAGANILYHRNEVGNHELEGEYESGPVLDFFTAVLNGDQAFQFGSGCSIQNLTIIDSRPPPLPGQ